MVYTTTNTPNYDNINDSNTTAVTTNYPWFGIINVNIFTQLRK
ncbi:MAG: hypothetical protein JWP71_1617 [Mucilaginibacter sp.]|nr:hypothetical protein [Mucilaginibacter sp.]